MISWAGEYWPFLEIKKIKKIKYANIPLAGHDPTI